MDEQTKRKMIRKYFEGPPAWIKAVMGVGVAALLIGLAPLILGWVFGLGPIWSLVGVGIVLIAIGGYADYRAKGSGGGGKPTDTQMDTWREEDLEKLTQKSLDKLGVDESELVAETVQVIGPRFWATAGADVLFKKGKDNVLRFTPVNVTVINFGKDQLLGYTCVFDITTGNALSEGTEEYFYKDVVSVSTKTESHSYDVSEASGRLEALGVGGVLQLNSAETFTLTTSGGTSLSVLLRDPGLIAKMGGKNAKIPTTHAEKAVQSIRKVLREKKT